jgi:iron complex outermembrane receptor protein
VSNRFLKPWLCLTSALAGFVAVDAHAQQAPAGGETLGEVVVTARRVEERLQDVPISIAVFNQQQLTNRNVVTAADLATYTPSLSTTNAFGENNATFAIRGFVQATATSPSVGVFFADVVQARVNGGIAGGNGAGPGSFFDLANVQVLKGPQGTLFGRNTTGGSILLVPNKPTDRVEGYIEGSLGNFGMKRIQAVLNAPLDDKVKFRFGVDHQSRDGFLHNVSSIGPSDFANINYTAVRASAVVDITEHLQNYTIFSFTDSDTHGDYPKAFGFNAAAPGGVAIPALLTGLPQSIAAASGDFYDVANGRPDAREHIGQWSVINTTTWRANDLITLKNITSYSQYRKDSAINIFGESSSFPGPPVSYNYIVSIGSVPGHSNTSESTATEEFQVQGHTPDNKFTYQTGAYLEVSLPLDGFQAYNTPILLNCSNPDAYQCTDRIGAIFGIPGRVGGMTVSQTKYKFHDWAFYAQGTYKFTDQLSLTGGIRYTKDRTEGLGENLHVSFPAPNTPNFGCNYPASFVVGGTSDQIRANNALCDVAAKQESSAPTWLIDLDYKPIDNTLFYVKYSRGYRQGSVNVSYYGLPPWAPEKVNTYEIGGKTSFDAIVQGTFNFAIFYNDFTNQQLQVNLLACTVADLTANPVQCPFIASPAAGIANAGKSTIKGIEIDSSIIPFHGLRLDFNYAYLDTKLDSATLPAPPIGFSQVFFPSIVGGPLAFSPKNKLAITANYTLPLDPGIGQVELGGTYTRQSSYFNSPTAAPGYETLPGQENLDLHINWNNVYGKPIDISFFATNVTKKKYFEATDGIYTSFGYDVAYLNPPTMYGARIRYRFGGK